MANEQKHIAQIVREQYGVTKINWRLYKWVKKFIERYPPALEALAKK